MRFQLRRRRDADIKDATEMKGRMLGVGGGLMSHIWTCHKFLSCRLIFIYWFSPDFLSLGPASLAITKLYLLNAPSVTPV